MSMEVPTRKVSDTASVLLRYSNEKGRYLTATRELKAGSVIISEKAFAEIPVHETEDQLFCSNCLNDLKTDVIKCLGCSYMIYCSRACKISAWKRHHWMECFLKDVWSKICPETRLALRAMLEGAYSLNGESSSTKHTLLHKIAQHLSGISNETSKDEKTYQSDYWSIYCLQRHEDESAAEDQFKSTYKDIQFVTEVLLQCFMMCNKFNVPEEDSEVSSKATADNHQEMISLLQSLFKKLSFSSYYCNERFDIREWKFHLEECCKTAPNLNDMQKKSIKDMLSNCPSTERQLFERLLLHHTLQVRTNGQAVFQICECSVGPSNVQNTMQIRVATGFFPITSLMNHSCAPNTSVSFDGKNITVVASKVIKKGEEICHCYGPHHTRHSVEERKQMLKEQYFFYCKCTACKEDLTEKASFNLQFHAFKCKYCGEPLRPDRETPPRGRCINEKCRKQQNMSQHVRTYMEFNALFENAYMLLDRGSVKESLHKLKGCMKMAEDILYHNHMDIAKLNDKIAQCYVILEDYASALTHLSKSISIVGMLYGTRSIEIAHELQKLASLHFNQRDLSQAGKIARRVISIYKTHCYKEDSFPFGADEMKKIVEICG